MNTTQYCSVNDTMLRRNTRPHFMHHSNSVDGQVRRFIARSVKGARFFYAMTTNASRISLNGG